jgi:hypothetical protein
VLNSHKLEGVRIYECGLPLTAAQANTVHRFQGVTKKPPEHVVVRLGKHLSVAHFNVMTSRTCFGEQLHIHDPGLQAVEQGLPVMVEPIVVAYTLAQQELAEFWQSLWKDYHGGVQALPTQWSVEEIERANALGY